MASRAADVALDERSATLSLLSAGGAPKPPKTKAAPKAAAPARPRSHSGEASKRGLKDKLKRKRPRSRGGSS